ncbi:hypothetical protein O6H91_14G043200 [Diphasiastrum complanatum]|uniref:Uncharacterized protein n=1 Tax=Diphasiastrum complanatum TaxID=34168 RepID=A0ACC2BNU9_DIPCM|nr:hypothetical protein O6H91_14G043200 [Diphasiastrum complanatum]
MGNAAADQKLVVSEMAKQYLIILILVLVSGFSSGKASTFTFVNKCDYLVWPGIQPNSGYPILANGGLALTPGQSSSLVAPYGWSGRFWARTGCNFDYAGTGSCATGDCNGKLLCDGAGGRPPATLIQITLNGDGGNDVYDVSLVDGFNVPVSVFPSGGYGSCGSPMCSTDMNKICPRELQVRNGTQVVACKSACLAFGSPRFCCTGAYSSICGPSNYSRLFKKVCPKAYSYAQDHRSTFYSCKQTTIYTIAFCPSESDAAYYNL